MIWKQLTPRASIINAIDPATLIERARNLSRRIKNSNLLTFDAGGHLILGHEEEIKNQISKFIGVYA